MCCVAYVCRLQVKQLADFKTAELNAKVLQLESHIHWLQQDNERLGAELQQARQVEAGGPAAAAAGGPGLAAMQVQGALRRLKFMLCLASDRWLPSAIPCVS